MFPESTRDHRLFLFREEIVKRLVQQFIYKEIVRRLQFSSSFSRILLKGYFSSSFTRRLLKGYSLVVHFQGDCQKFIGQYFIFKKIVRRLFIFKGLLEGYSLVFHFQEDCQKVVHFQGDCLKVIVLQLISKEIGRRLVKQFIFREEYVSLIEIFLFVQVWIHCLCNTSRAATQQCYILYYTSIYSLQW